MSENVNLTGTGFTRTGLTDVSMPGTEENESSTTTGWACLQPQINAATTGSTKTKFRISASKEWLNWNVNSNQAVRSRLSRKSQKILRD